MEYGFVKTAAVSPKIRVADPVYNGTEIIRLMKENWATGDRIIVFPELCITGCRPSPGESRKALQCGSSLFGWRASGTGS